MVGGADRRRLQKGLAIGFMNKSLVLKLHARARKNRKEEEEGGRRKEEGGRRKEEGGRRKDTSWSQ